MCPSKKVRALRPRSGWRTRPASPSSRASALTEKCQRCWRYTDDVGSHAEHPDACARCADAVLSKGEAA
ncbi:MAG: zinc finger domain-containing protein [Parvularculaceae bacterium]|nr:zinc finger domain-containing protein [Parvularculaceae bacterium]